MSNMQKRQKAAEDQAIETTAPISPSSHDKKRRKVRRGTQSCWECKRRKAKCSWFNGPQSKGSCDACRRRGSKCVSQEYDDDPANQKQQLSDRITRLEDIIVSSSGERCTNETIQPQRALNGSDTGRLTALNWGRPSRRDQSPYLDSRPEESGSAERLSGALLAVWPNTEDLAAITAAPMSVEVFHTIKCLHRVDASSSALPSATDLLKTPEVGKNPILICRSLIYLASFLQCLLPDDKIRLRQRLSSSPEEIMDAAFSTATRLVTSDLGLISTAEGVECIMMEAMYLNNAGRLRLAWLAVRRAISTAQLIGLDRTTTAQNLSNVEEQQQLDTEYTWLRIVGMDSYLSLQLGLPLGIFNAEPIHPDLMARAGSQERLERAIIHAGGFICQRKTSGALDLERTRKIDDILLEVSKSMPAHWWLVPNVKVSSGNRGASLARLGQFMMQMAYYHILERLHLPYLVNFATERASDYNRAVALHASREVLRRYVAFREGTPPGSHFCRGIDFLAFGASTTICLGRIQTRFPPEQIANSVYDGPSSFGNLMEHQGLTDRGLMESAKHQLMLAADYCPTDPIAGRIATGLTNLLAVDADVANGKAYRLGSIGKQEGCDPGTGSRGTFDDDNFIIIIPHIGDIKFVRHSLSYGLQATDLQTPYVNRNHGTALQGDHLGNVTSPVREAASDQAISSGRRSSLSFQDHLDPGPSIAEPNMAGIPGIASIENSGLHQSYTQFSDFLTGGDMGMQGVDVAWFDTLFMDFNEGSSGR